MGSSGLSRWPQPLLILEGSKTFPRTHMQVSFHLLKISLQIQTLKGFPLLPGSVVPMKPTVTNSTLKNPEWAPPSPSPCWTLKSSVSFKNDELSEADVRKHSSSYRAFRHLTPGLEVHISQHEVQGGIWQRPANLRFLKLSWYIQYSLRLDASFLCIWKMTPLLYLRGSLWMILAFSQSAFFFY